MQAANAPQKIGLITATSLVVGNMVASGVFMLPATLAGYGGISLIGWLVSGVGALTLALVFGWLSNIRPAATGGPYAYTRDGLGDFAGFLVAWGYWISIWCTNAAITVAFVSYLSAFFPLLATNSLMAVAAGLSAIWFLTWINSRGIRQAGMVQVATTLLKLTPLIAISIGGLFYLNSSHFTPFNRSDDSALFAITSSTTLTLFAFLGIECATIPSESIANPGKTIARATIIGTLITTVVYMAGTVAVMGILPQDQLVNSGAPFADAAAAVWGEPARYVVAAGAVIATFGALNGWIVMQGQLPYAAARDKLFPRVFSVQNKRQVPIAGIVISSILISVMMGMNFTRNLADTFRVMVLLATLTTLVPYCFSAASYAILIVRERPDLPRIRLRLFVTLVAFLFSVWAIAGSGREIVFWGFIMLICGVPFYVVMKFKQDSLSTK